MSEKSVAYKVWPKSPTFDDGPPHVVMYWEHLDEALSYVGKNKIESIELSSHGTGKKLIELDLSFLRGMKNIVGFGCRFGISKYSDISALYECQKIESLVWPSVAPDLNLSLFGNLRNLMCRQSSAISGLDALEKLKYFRLSTSGQDLLFLQSLRSLEKIEIADSKIETMLGVEGLHQLEEVVVFPSPNLLDISAIGKCKKIKNLHFEKMKRLSDYSDLGNSKSIQNLEILSPVDSVDFVPKIKSLNRFFCHEIKSKNTAPLIEAKSLKYINIHPDKRDYSHSLDEIKSALGI